jgi:MFS family permease
MALGGIGFSLALPAVTMSVVSRVAPPDIGRASGTFSTMRQLGGAFGIAILGAAFAATGGYASPRAFTDGYTVALAGAAGLALAGALAGALLPARRPRPDAPATSPPAPSREILADKR